MASPRFAALSCSRKSRKTIEAGGPHRLGSRTAMSVGLDVASHGVDRRLADWLGMTGHRPRRPSG
jgi:hypothetical protein